MAPTLPLGAAATARADAGPAPARVPGLPPSLPPTLPNDMQGRVLACAPCHGRIGEGGQNPYFPRLAGKPVGYLFNQLSAFKEARRRYPPMNYLLEFQRDDYLRQMAAFFAAQRPPAPPPLVPTVSDAVLAHGDDLVHHGAPGRGIPPCVACHNPRLTGLEPGIPGLLGLNSQYITAQLGAWRYGTRTATAPDCMQLVAARLTETDVTALAAWLASQPVPPDPSPAPAGTLRTPLRCGSEPQ